MEALIGLGVVALLIAYLPSIYGHFSRREEHVLRFEVRAGSPPTPTVYLTRLHVIGWTERLGVIWEPFETWFENLQESHTSQPSLALYRSQSLVELVDHHRRRDARHGRHLRGGPRPPDPARGRPHAAGRVSSPSATSPRSTGCRVDADPAPNDPISVTQAEFFEVLDELEQIGLPVRDNREKAWRDFAGWRVNYDQPLLALCALVEAPPAMWSSDRCTRFHRPTLRHPRSWRVEPLDAPPSW